MQHYDKVTLAVQYYINLDAEHQATANQGPKVWYDYENLYSPQVVDNNKNQTKVTDNLTNTIHHGQHIFYKAYYHIY